MGLSLKGEGRCLQFADFACLFRSGSDGACALAGSTLSLRLGAEISSENQCNQDDHGDRNTEEEEKK
jgi:hypothetical protein